MESLMEPIYSYLYGTYSMEISTELNISFDVVLDDKTLNELLEQTVRSRFTQGVEQAYLVLRNHNRKFHASLDQNLLFKYYYLLAIVSYERYDPEELEDAYGHCLSLFHQNQLEAEWIKKFSLLSSLYGTVDNEEGALQKGLDWINLNSNEKKSLLFSLTLYFGSTAMHYEQYIIAKDFLESGLARAESAHQKSLALGNLGALYFALDDFKKSIEFYKEAIRMIDQQELDDYWSEKVRLMFFENMRNMEIRDAARKQEFIKPDPLFLKENDLDYAQRMRNIAKRYVTNETYEENLRGRNGFRASNNLYEANRYFNKAERSYQLLGNVQGRKTLIDEKIRYFLNASKVVKSQILERIALEHAIMINDDKTIKGLLQDRIPFNTSEEIKEFSKWLFSSEKNRVVRLGRTHCLGYLADYIPEEYVKKAFEEIWNVLHGEWSFTKDFDFKRTAMKALSRLFPRLCDEDKNKVINKLWESIEQTNMLVKHQAAETLTQIGDLSDFIYLDSHFLRLMNYLETTSDQNREYSLLMKHFINVSKNVEEEMKIKAVNVLLNKWAEGNYDAINVFLSDHLVPFVKQEIREEIVKKGIDELKKEIKVKPTNVYSMKAYEWGGMLAYFLPLVVSTPLFKEAETVLIEFISSEHIDPSKRALVLKGIFYLLRNDSDFPIDHNDWEKACLHCLYKKSTWDHTEFDPFSNHHYLLPELFSVLSKLIHPIKEAEGLINRFIIDTLMLKGDALSESLLAMTSLAMKPDAQSEFFIPIVSRLHNECKNEDQWVRASAIYGLMQLGKSSYPSDTYWAYIQSAMEIAHKDPSRIVRYQLALGIPKLLNLNLVKEQRERIENIEQTLKTDISYSVRNAVCGRKKVDE